MNSTASAALRAISVGGVVAGTIDIGAAALINRVSPVLIAHGIASGALGNAAFTGGAGVACFGVVLQWVLSIIIAAIYWVVTARLPVLRTRWWLGGLLAGVVIYLVMNFIVMPFSAAPITLHHVITHFHPVRAGKDLLAMFLFGLIIACSARYLASPAAETEVAVARGASRARR